MKVRRLLRGKRIRARSLGKRELRIGREKITRHIKNRASGLPVALASMVFLLAAPVTVRAQELRPFAITAYGGELAYEFLYQDELVESATTQQDFEEILMKETIGIWSKGYVYHPNLLDFDIGLTFGLGQERERGTFEDDDDSTLIGYDVHLAIEKKQPYGVDIFALKDQRLVDQKFARNSLVDIETYQLLWSTNNQILPTTVRLSSLTKDESGVLEREEDEQRIEVRSTHRWGDFSRSSFSYNYRDFTEDQIGTTTEVESHEVSLANTLTLGNEGEGRLNTHFRYRTEEGVTDTDQTSLFSSLTWEHTPNLESFFDFNLNDSSTSFTGDGIAVTQDTLSHTERIGLRHRLYENLNTIISLDNNSIDSDQLGQDRYGGDIDFRYVRPIPIGQISANFGYSLHRTDQTSENLLIAVIDELHVWAVGFFFELDNTNVEPGSVVVKRPDGIPLTEGFDYSLTVVGNRTRVNMLSDFNINNGEQARVDYLFMPPGDLVYDTTEFRAGAALNLFNKLDIIYAFSESTNDLREGDREESGLQDTTNHRVDVRYLALLPYRFNSETSAFYQNRDSTFSPSESYGFAERVRRPIRRNIDGEIAVSYATSDFPDTDDETNVLVAEGRVTTRLGPRSQLIFNALYRDVGGTIEDRTEYELSLLFQTVFRLVTCQLEISYEDVSEISQDRESTLVFFRLSRQF